MALKHCPECHREVSERAKRCQHCGFQRYRTTNGIMFGVFLLLAFASPSFGQSAANDRVKSVIARANEAQTTNEGIAIIESSDVYKRGYARQTTEMKLAMVDAKTRLSNAEAKYKALKEAEQQGYGDLHKSIDALNEEGDAQLRLFKIYVLIMNDG